MVLIAVLLGLATGSALAPTGRANPRWLSLALSGLACAVILGLALTILATGTAVAADAGRVLGFTLIDVRYDALSAVFLVALGAVGVASSVFGIGRDAHGVGQGDWTAAAYPIFLASLALVFGAVDGFAFLFAWELMALSSAALVIGSRPTNEVARAGYVYLAMTHLATAALIVAFAILGTGSGSVSFAGFAATAEALPPAGRDVVFILLLIAFATKAGAIPVHIWLPRAHPIAPSHVSALMSGVMIKAGIYGLIRLGIDVLGHGPEWWGLLVLVVGVGSAVLGVLYALMEHDLKRLLAFHSIENVGIILIGVGIAMIANSNGATALAQLALVAALFHTLNHALFKGALFLAAGSIQAAAGTRDLNSLGGLARAMPITTLAFGIAAAAISGLPPLNGFASEWLTFQALIGAGGASDLSPVARSAALLAVGGLGLTAALAVACFVKATGIAFLGLPRTAAAVAASEVNRWMRWATATLGAACVAVGLAAGPTAVALGDVAAGVVVGGAPPGENGPLVAVQAGSAAYAAGPLGVVLVMLATGTWLLTRRGRTSRRTATWTCGIAPEPAFEYTATSFAKLIRLYFGPILRPAREVTVALHPGTPFPRTIHYRGEVTHLLDARLYGPLHRAAVAAAQLIRRLQSGSLQLYLAYAVAALIGLLVLAR
jgi:hydrogenase-4 component B